MSFSFDNTSLHLPQTSADGYVTTTYLLIGEKITQDDLANVFSKAYVSVATMKKPQSGFKTSGNWPFQPEKFTDFTISLSFACNSSSIEIYRLMSVLSSSNKTIVESTFTNSLLENISPFPKLIVLTDTCNKKTEGRNENRRERKNRLEVFNNETTASVKLKKGTKRKAFEDSES